MSTAVPSSDNLRRYPMTQEEQIRLLKQLIENQDKIIKALEQS